MTTTARLDAAGARHLLRRLAFGAPVRDVERCVGRERGEVVEELVADARAAPIDEEVRLLLPAGEVEYVQAWWLESMLGPVAQRVRERVALMWHGHFATSFDKVGDVHLVYAQNELFRTAGLGDFRALLHAVVVDPAMLVWLDGVENEKGRPNENLARELMELFALGIGNYDERDVKEAARALSGWTVRQRRASFVARRFDDGEKSVLGRSGRLGTREVVEAVLASEACPRWIARRLFRTLHAADPSEAEVAATARELVANEFDVGRTLSWLATRERFHAETERAARISGPVEYVVRTLLESGASLPATECARDAARMGQELLRPPSVEGWHEGRAWMSSTGWLARMRFARRVAGAVDEDPAELAARLGVADSRPWYDVVVGNGSSSDVDARTAVLASAEYQLQ
ncbi:MAG: DUF1800 family protein [Planctomycetota bacterium]